MSRRSAPSTRRIDHPTDDRPQVAVIGGGMAGVHAAARLTKQPVGVTIIEPTGHHQFLTRLAAVAGGTQPPRDAAVPLSELFPTAAIERDHVVALDETPGSVVVQLTDNRTLTVDAAIVTAGAESTAPPIPGLHRALTVRSAREALELRSSLDPADRLVVIGGGATGCQLAGAAAVANPGLEVTLIESSSRLLSGFRPVLGRRTAQILGDRGIGIECDTGVERVRKNGVTLSSEGRRIDGLVVWAGGVAAAGARFGVGDTREGRLVVDDTGRVMGCSRIFAAGDVAAHTDRNGVLRPMSAQIAAQAGRTVGTNAARFVLGHSPTTLDLTDLGWVVDLGGGRGVAEILGLPLADPITDRLVPLLHTAIDYRNLWQIGGIGAMRRHGPGRSTTPTVAELGDELAEFGLGL